VLDEKKLLSKAEELRVMMIAVSTGGPKIDDVNGDYIHLQDTLTLQLVQRGIENPNPYGDLWAWYGKWSSGDLPTYQSRREYISGLFEPLIKFLKTKPSKRKTVTPEEPTGWARVDRALSKIREQLESSRDEEDFQQVGLLCREALISLAQATFKVENHPSLDGTKIGKTDSRRMLEALLAVELGGGSNEAARKHAKAALALANDTQHRRTAAFRDAALCSEATTAVVNIVAIVLGKRDPKK
jgi:uncharacterized protein YutE (UPF0331/DUF86 family)